MIDDNPLDHLIMQRMFDKFKLFPDATHSLDARESMDFISQNVESEVELPDVIFLDLSMPGFSGSDFLKDFKDLYKKIKKHIDIYILSSSVEPNDQMLSKKYSFVKAYIGKPIKMETLLSLHSTYLFHWQAAG